MNAVQLISQIFELAVDRRWTEAAPNMALEALITLHQHRYEAHIEAFLANRDFFARIPLTADKKTLTPHWNNGWMEGLDLVSIYGFIASRKPQTYLEIGSGNSTMFARRSIDDHGLSTQLISIDPQPRADIDTLCTQILRKRLEFTNWPPLVKKLEAGDILFFDGSHRCFQNSDVTVFFNEILPEIPPGVLIGVHDIFLPADYINEWLGRYYSEQYLLASWLLADKGRSLQIELPVYWVHNMPSAAELRMRIDPLWQNALPKGVGHGGGAFWFTKKE